MKKFNGYMAGVNIGGWISQYPQDANKEYWDTCCVPTKDIARIASWKCDHIRLPVDYFFFESDDDPGVYAPDRIAYIDMCLEECKKNGLNMILDLHHAPGFFFALGDKNKLFVDPALQDRFVAIWKFFAERYKDEGDNIAFELMNELVWSSSEPWNDLWTRTLAEIRKISPDRYVIIGSNNWNSVWELKNLRLIENDKHLIYNFHFYDPQIFTHQRAPWDKVQAEYNGYVTFPYRFEDHKRFFELLNYWPEMMASYEIVDKEFIRRMLEPAVEFLAKHDIPLYCSEFGVIDWADEKSSLYWLDTVCDIFNEFGIGHSVWSYTGFTPLFKKDENGNKLENTPFIEIISRM